MSEMHACTCWISTRSVVAPSIAVLGGLHLIGSFSLSRCLPLQQRGGHELDGNHPPQVPARQDAGHQAVRVQVPLRRAAPRSPHHVHPLRRGRVRAEGHHGLAGPPRRARAVAGGRGRQGHGGGALLRCLFCVAVTACRSKLLCAALRMGVSSSLLCPFASNRHCRCCS